MGTLFSNSAKRAAFRNQVHPAGLDRLRSQIDRNVGVEKAASSTSFRAGSPLMFNTSRELVLADASGVYGIAMANKISLGRSIVIDEEVNFGTADATVDLAHANVGSVVVRSAVEGGGTTYTVTTDYTVNSTNGTVTHVNAGSIDEAEPVYVSYSWSLTEDDYKFEGKNFWNQMDDVTIQDGRIAVVLPPAQIFTTEFAPNVVYSLSGANSNVYINASGLFTSASGSARLVGAVISVPTNDDPFLGIEFRGSALVQS